LKSQETAAEPKETAEGEEAAAPADTSYKVGSAIGVELLLGVKNLDITGVTKGRGFQGAVRRHGYKTGRRTHGSHFHRRPGSLGSGTTPGRVMKNKKMPGHMGTNQITVQNLKIVDVDTEARTVAIRGSVPGRRDGYLVLKPSLKKVRG
jgi:large subunit ribosomal protein L3